MSPTGADLDGNSISPLPGEAGIPDVAAAQRTSISKKGLFALVLLLGGLIGVAALGIHRFAVSGKPVDADESARVGDKPSAATAEPRRLDMAPSASAAAVTPRIPALMPDADEIAEPIGVRRTGAGSPAPGGTRQPPPEDAPILLVASRSVAAVPPHRHADGAGAANGPAMSPSGSEAGDPLAATSRNLEGYQRQLQGLLDSLTKTADLASGPDPHAINHPAPCSVPRLRPGFSPTRVPARRAGCSAASCRPRPHPGWRRRRWATAA